MPKSSGRKQEHDQLSSWYLRRSTLRALIVFVLAIAGLGVEYCRDGGGRGPSEAASTDRDRFEDQVFRIDHVIDGDTAVLSDGTSVRLIGIDAPEMVPVQQCGAMEATQLNRELIDEKTVTLRLDPAETRDRFGRLLAYLEGCLGRLSAGASGLSSMITSADPHAVALFAVLATLFFYLYWQHKMVQFLLWGLAWVVLMVRHTISRSYINRLRFHGSFQTFSCCRSPADSSSWVAWRSLLRLSWVAEGRC
jgi:hypothetical protein